MADKNDDVLGDLLDPKKLLEQLRDCETKQRRGRASEV